MGNGANFTNSDLTGADLSYSDLTNANFQGANTHQTNFSNCILTGTSINQPKEKQENKQLYTGEPGTEEEAEEEKVYKSTEYDILDDEEEDQ